MRYDRPITIQKIDEATETWADIYKVHARINGLGGQEKAAAGSEMSQAVLRFDMRYFAQLEDIFLNRQLYRIVYKGSAFDIIDYDDFELQHKEVRLKGQANE